MPIFSKGQRVVLNSPYGKLICEGGIHIGNGETGTVLDPQPGKHGVPVELDDDGYVCYAPAHWLRILAED